MNTIKLKIEGFHCEACVRIAKMKIGKIDGVSGVEARLSGDAKVFAQRFISIDEINDALFETGYRAEIVKDSITKNL